MSIRFTCPHCGKLLSVARRKAGHAVQCPTCAGGVIVPPPAEIATRRVPPASTPPVTSPRHEPSGPAHQASLVEVPRTTLYSMGILIVGCSILAFVLGFLMGQQTGSPSGARATNVAHQISGILRFETDRGELAADSEAVVIALPVDKQPDEKFDAAAVRPEAPSLNTDDPLRLGIRSMGGDYDRTSPTGRFSIQVPRSGEYFLLFLSSHRQRRRDAPPTTVEIAQIAKYFKPADVLLGSNAYRWTKQTLQADVTIEHTFPR